MREGCRRVQNRLSTAILRHVHAAGAARRTTDDTRDRRSLLRAPLAGRGGCCLPVSYPSRSRARSKKEGHLHPPRRRRRSARRSLVESTQPARPSAGEVHAQRSSADAGDLRSLVRTWFSAADAARGRRARGQGLSRHAPPDPAGSARRCGSASPRPRISGPCDYPWPDRRQGCRALAQDGVGRIPAQRRVWFQRRTHRQLRSGGRRDRRGDGQSAPGGCSCRPGGFDRRCLVDGSQRVSRQQERARGLRVRDLDGENRSRSDAGDRARRAGCYLRSEGNGSRLRALAGDTDHGRSSADAEGAGPGGAQDR